MTPWRQLNRQGLVAGGHRAHVQHIMPDDVTDAAGRRLMQVTGHWIVHIPDVVEIHPSDGSNPPALFRLTAHV